MNPQQLKNIIEAALLTAGGPLAMTRLEALFADEASPPDAEQIKGVLDALTEDYAERGIELKQVSSGYRIQARQDMSQWLNRLAEEKPPRYSRALLETLALIAYRQPITRGGVEDIRGVGVSSSIIKTLLERDWIRVVGHRDVPGRPALYGTTKQFLDYFNLKSLSELPDLAEMRSIDDIQRDFELNYGGDGEGGEAPAADAATADEVHDAQAHDETPPSVTAEADSDAAEAGQAVTAAETGNDTSDNSEVDDEEAPVVDATPAGEVRDAQAHEETPPSVTAEADSDTAETGQPAVTAAAAEPETENDVSEDGERDDETAERPLAVTSA
jgi:segregation and condensation protein B